MPEPSPETTDFAIVGAGPAGLHAALKAALLFHTAVVFDKGKKHSRIFFAPRIDNIPGFPGGISGAQLLKKQREHIAAYEKEQGRAFVEFVEPSEVVALRRASPEEPFELTVRVGKEGREVTRRARTVVLATGLVDRQPFIGEWTEKNIKPILPYANKGIVDYCMLCDGHVMKDKDVAVIGADRGAIGLAASLREQFGARVTAIACIPCALGEPHVEDGDHASLEARARKLGVPLLLKGIRTLEGIKDDRLRLGFDDGTQAEFDKGLLSFGWYKMNTELARAMGGLVDEAGYVRTTEDCEVLGEGEEPIPGLFAVGDIRSETWNQIPPALGDAESAVIHAYATRL